jgi:OmpR-family two-component system manganese-sensing sensor histidine kinase
MFQTTRRRLALWYTAVTAVLLLLFASGVYLYVRSTLIERVDDTLNHVVEVVRRSLVIEPINPHIEGGPLRVNVAASFRDDAATAEDDRIDIEWFSASGELLWSTLEEPFDLPLHPNRDGETVRVQKQSNPGKNSSSPSSPSAPSPPLLPSGPLLLRQITQRIEVGQSVLGYLRVSHPWFEVTKPSREFFFDLALGIGLMITAVGEIGWLLSGLAMAPVRESYQRLKQFTADASHELRSPIAVIQTNVQVALSDPNPDPEIQQQHFRVVERLTRRLGRLVDDLLFLARQDSGMVQPQRVALKLDGLLQEVVEEQQAIATAKEIQLVFQSLEPTNAQGDLESWVMLQADRDQMARLFTNLVGNAVQYTPVAGKISIDLQQVGRPGNFSLQVRVKDTGIGIPPEALPLLFDRFYRVDPARRQSSASGSGLGLAIAWAIVQNHHGQIQIESTPHQGTTVIVTLPQKDWPQKEN